MTQPTSDERFDFNRPLWNPVGNQTIGYAQQIYDGDMQKKQSTINAEVQASIEDVEDLLAAAL